MNQIFVEMIKPNLYVTYIAIISKGYSTDHFENLLCDILLLGKYGQFRNEFLTSAKI